MIRLMKIFFDRNLFLRIFSGILFVACFIIFIHYGGILFILFFLLLLSLMILEINISFKISDKYYLNFIINILIVISIFHFIFLRIIYGVNIINYLYYIIASIWIFDSFSLIGGKLIGGKKLIPKISPNKTYSGLITGFIALLFISFITLEYNSMFDYTIIFYTFCIGVFAFLGDALESYLKRKFNIKDMSNLLPGHGGILDRMDAFIFIFFIHFIITLLNINLISLYA